MWHHVTMVALFLDDKKPKTTAMKGVIGFYWQNNKFARASCYFCTFLCCRCNTATWNFLISHARYGVGEHNTKSCLFLFLNLGSTVLSDSTREISPTFSNEKRLNNIDEVWSFRFVLIQKFWPHCTTMKCFFTWMRYSS